MKSLSTTALLSLAIAQSSVCNAQVESAPIIIQTEDPATVVSTYMRNTQMPVSACLKHMKANGLSVQPQDLSNAIKLNDYSKLLFDAGNYGEALICSSKARQLAVNALAQFRGDEYAGKYAKYANETAEYLLMLSNDTSTMEEWTTRVKLN